MDDSLLNLLRGCTNLPSPPAVASLIIELSSSHSSTLADVADAVSVDPALSVKILRMANSPLYSRQRHIENLRQAISLFGIEGTLNIALSFSLKQSSDTNSQSGLDYNQYWKRSLASALFSQELSQRADGGSKDSLFLMGLLQDIGMIALDKVHPNLYQSMNEAQSNHALVCAREIEEIGEDHSQIGVWLLQRWNLPETIIKPIANSHLSNLQNTEREIDSPSRCIAVSSMLADIFVAEDTETTIYNAISEAQKVIKLELTDYNDIIESVSQNFAMMAKMFDIKLDDPLILDSICDQAKEILTIRNLNIIHETEKLQEEAKELKEQAEKLEHVSRQDALTSLYNRRHFDETVAVEFENSKKFKWPLGIIFIDLDHFKNVNDTYGHKFGDDVLTHSAKVILDCMRDTDIVSRYGGEEFVVLLPGTDQVGTEAACRRIIQWFHNHPVQLNSTQNITQTISAGAVVYCGGDDYLNWTQLINDADTALYQAKGNGRDQYCMYSSDMAVKPLSHAM